MTPATGPATGPVVVIGCGAVGLATVTAPLLAASVPVTVVAHSRGAAAVVRGGVRLVQGDAAGSVTTTLRPPSVLACEDAEAVAAAVATARHVVVATSPGEERSVGDLLTTGLLQARSAVDVLVCANEAGQVERLRQGLPRRSLHRAPIGCAAVLVDQIVTCDTDAQGRRTLRAESHRRLVVDAAGLVGRPALERPALPHVHGGLPELAGLPGFSVSTDVERELERKLFSFSAGHAAAAYLGAVRGHERIRDAVLDPFVGPVVRAAVEEGVAVLRPRLGPLGGALTGSLRPGGAAWAGGLPDPEVLLNRYANPVLRDTTARVGRDPVRKLASCDRIVLPALLALATGGSADALAVTAAAALASLTAGDDWPGQLRRVPVAELFAHTAQIPLHHELTRLVARASDVLGRSHSPVLTLAALRAYSVRPVLVAVGSPEARARRTRPAALPAERHLAVVTS